MPICEGKALPSVVDCAERVIEVEWGRRARTLLEEAEAEVRYAEYPLPHTIHPGFLLQVRDWLTERVGSTV